MFLSAHWRAFALALALAIFVPIGTKGQPDPVQADVRDAIVSAVRARMGAAAEINIGEIYVRLLKGQREQQRKGAIVALPDAGARTGGFVRFLLFDGPVDRRLPARRLGSADVELHVTIPHLRASHALSPRAIVGRADVERVTADVGRMPLQVLPPEGAIVGARVLRPIAAGKPIVAAMVAATPLVRSGDEVRTIVRVGTLEVRGMAIAAQTGTLGEKIRVVNADSRRALEGRVVGEGQVEVIHEN
jgi:flagella basal body P-ring formation protein FlgA